MSTWLFSRLAFVDKIKPPHEIDNFAKLENLKSSILKSGWRGPPLIVNGDQALTGTHRLAAAKQIGLRLVPVVELSVLDESDLTQISANPSRAELKLVISSLPITIRHHYDANTSSFADPE